MTGPAAGQDDTQMVNMQEAQLTAAVLPAADRVHTLTRLLQKVSRSRGDRHHRGRPGHMGTRGPSSSITPSFRVSYPARTAMAVRSIPARRRRQASPTRAVPVPLPLRRGHCAAAATGEGRSTSGLRSGGKRSRYTAAAAAVRCSGQQWCRLTGASNCCLQETLTRCSRWMKRK
jgi:hypothetical protein